MTGQEGDAVKQAVSLDDLLAALEKKIAKEVTPNVVPPGAMILQPSDERRRSGSQYTPRILTEPIVRKTLEPILKRLGDQPTPEQILALKICAPAMGSAAFLVEACRQLGDVLVASWHAHNQVPRIPPDEDEILHARRLIAQRCLYGVDKNAMAVDLAKLSLWLVTLARDHPFTFLDHALRCGDSLVGLTRRQIADFGSVLVLRCAARRILFVSIYQKKAQFPPLLSVGTVIMMTKWEGHLELARIKVSRRNSQAQGLIRSPKPLALPYRFRHVSRSWAGGVVRVYGLSGRCTARCPQYHPSRPATLLIPRI